MNQCHPNQRRAQLHHPGFIPIKQLIMRTRDPDSKIHGAHMGPIWGRQDPGGPDVGPLNFAIWDVIFSQCPSTQRTPVSYGTGNDVPVAMDVTTATM